ncbi:MAG: PIG-L family deacetylase, partial [Phenylobacterium sp.]
MEHLLVPYVAHSEIPARSVLVLAPHPDDEAFGCGGAILRHVEQATPVRVAVATDGALGLGGKARARYTERRRGESRAAAAILGYGEPEFWGLPDQSLAYGEALVAAILQAMAGADLVYAPSVYEMHPDHRALGMAAVEAVRRAGGATRLALYEIGVPLPPNLLLDITAFAERKQQAMACFSSQLETQRYDLHVAALNRFRTYTLPPEVTAAEAYLLVTADDLAGDALKLYRSEHQRQAALGLPLDASDLPLVSVLIRSMHRRELSEALDSVALQTYPNIEVVVIDACGAHPWLAATCGRFPLRLVGAGEPLAHSRAANLALEAASGQLAIFLDDDDLFLPDHVARLVERLAREPGLRAAYAGVRVDDASGMIDVYDTDFPPARLAAWNHLPIHAVLFDRDLFLEGCRFDETLEVYEDWDFWLQLSRRTGFARVPGVSAIYRAHLGRSPLSQPACPQAARGRRQVWRKWLERWDAADLEAL